MGWAGYDFTKEFDGVHEEDRHQGQLPRAARPRIRCSPRASCRCRPARSTSSSRPWTASPAWVENGIVQPWDGQDQPRRLRPGLRHRARPARWRRSAASATSCPASGAPRRWSINTEQAPMEYGKASLGDLFDPKYVGKVTVRAALGARRHGPRTSTARASCRSRCSTATRTRDVMRQNWDIALAEAIKPRPTSCSSGTARTRPRRRSAPTAACSACAGTSTGFNLQNDGLPFGYHRPEGRAPSPGSRASCPDEERQERRAGPRVRELRRRRPKARRCTPSAFSANPVAKGAIDSPTRR